METDKFESGNPSIKGVNQNPQRRYTQQTGVNSMNAPSYKLTKVTAKKLKTYIPSRMYMMLEISFN
jgi:hypothetical protein